MHKVVLDHSGGISLLKIFEVRRGGEEKYATYILSINDITLLLSKIYAKIPSLIFLMNHQHQLHLSCQSPMVGNYFYFFTLSEDKLF